MKIEAASSWRRFPTVIGQHRSWTTPPGEGCGRFFLSAADALGRVAREGSVAPAAPARRVAPALGAAALLTVPLGTVSDSAAAARPPSALKRASSVMGAHDADTPRTARAPSSQRAGAPTVTAAGAPHAPAESV